MKLSLVTGARNRPDSLQRLVDSIEANTGVDWELIIADASDCVPYGLMLSAKTSPTRLTWIHESPRRGCSRGYNQAFAKAEGDWVIWLNDDCEVMPGYAEKAIAFMEAHPQIGLGALPYSNKGGPFMVNSNSFDGLVYANFGIIRRELGNQIGWFDEIVNMYGCDNSIGFRVLLAGYGIAEVPGQFILHHEHPDEQRAENLKGQHQDAEKLKAKYEPLLPQMRATYERCRAVTA
jgi:GT2 family glycosyltransferase